MSLKIAGSSCVIAAVVWLPVAMPARAALATAVWQQPTTGPAEAKTQPTKIRRLGDIRRGQHSAADTPDGPPEFAVSLAAFEAAYAKDPAILRWVNEKPHVTLLDIAAGRGDDALVKRLLQLGLDPNGDPTYREKPLDRVLSGEWIRATAPEFEKRRADRKMEEGDPHDEAHWGPMRFVETADVLLKGGADINAVDDRGRRRQMLLGAVRTKNVALFDLFEKAGAKLETVPARQGQASELNRALLQAAVPEAGDPLPMVERVLKAGASPSLLSESEARQLTRSASANTHVLDRLRAAGLPEDRFAELTAAVQGEAPERLEQMLKADATQADKDKALKIAVRQEAHGMEAKEVRQRRVVELLLDAGAKINAGDETGGEVVDVFKHSPAIGLLLVKRGAKIDWARQDLGRQRTPEWLCWGSALERNIPRLKALDEAGMPLDATGAAVLGKVDRIRELVKGDPRAAKSVFGMQALWFAAREGKLEACRALLDGGAKVDQTVSSGFGPPEPKETPLKIAAEEGHLDVVKLLLQRGADAKIVVGQESWFTEKLKDEPIRTELLKAAKP